MNQFIVIVGFQLTLGLKIGAKTTLDNFITGKNKELVDFLKELLQTRQSVYAHVLGAPATGKTHLFQAACQALVYQGFQAGYIDLSHLNHLEILKGLHQLKLVCFDNLDAVSNEQDLHLLGAFIKTAMGKGHQILTASKEPLPEIIKQYIHSHDEFKLEQLHDKDLKTAVKLKAEERGLLLPADVEECLIIRAEISPYPMKEIISLLDKLERACDLEKKKVNLSFFKTILKE